MGNRIYLLNFSQDKASHIDSGFKQVLFVSWIKHSNIYIWFIFILLMLPFKKQVFLENFKLCELSEGSVKPATILLSHQLFVNVIKWCSKKQHLQEISVLLC